MSKPEDLLGTWWERTRVLRLTRPDFPAFAVLFATLDDPLARWFDLSLKEVSDDALTALHK